MATIPVEFQNSAALRYIISKGWQYKQTDSERVELETCPFCSKSGFGHFYIRTDGTNQDGLFLCHKCGNRGNLTLLKTKMGDAISGVTSTADWSRGGEREQETLPNIQVLHEALLADADAMDYLMNGRGFSRAVIERTKIGLTKRHFRECGEVRAIVYPYFVQNNCIFVHYRSLPPSPKAFNSPKGWDAPLYNGEIIRDGLKDIVMVEGEANTISALDKGIENIVGVPGANFKKALWIEELDRIAPERIYICYDKDKVGQKAAQSLASRIGIEKCYKIVLPDFTFATESGEERVGKDLNEWFVHAGGTAEAFEELKKNAVLFDVQGVASTNSALDEFEDFLNNKENLSPTYATPWGELNHLVGFEDGDVIDIVAPEKVGKTTIGMNMMEYAVDRYGEDGVIICLEMTVLRLSKKWVSHVTNTPDLIPKTPEESVYLLNEFKKAVPSARARAANRPGVLYFCYPQYSTVDEIYKLIRDCVRRYGVKWVMIDNLQRLCDTTLKGSQNRTVHLSQISKTLSQIAKDFNIKMIRILQPHRIGDGKVVTTDDVDGSSQISKDCDCMMAIHRNPAGGELTQKDIRDLGYVKTEQALDSLTLVNVGLSRYSGGGKVTLFFDGATSTLKNFNQAEILALNNGVPASYAEHNQTTGIAALASAVAQQVPEEAIAV